MKKNFAEQYKHGDLISFYHAQKIRLHKIKERIKVTTLAIIMHNCTKHWNHSPLPPDAAIKLPAGVQGCTAGDGSIEHDRRRRMDASKTPTHARPDLLPFGGEGQSVKNRVDRIEIDGHTIRKAFSRFIYYIAYLSRSDNPDEKILLKVNLKLDFMPIHLQGAASRASVEVIEQILARRRDHVPSKTLDRLMG